MHRALFLIALLVARLLTAPMVTPGPVPEPKAGCCGETCCCGDPDGCPCTARSAPPAPASQDSAPRPDPAPRFVVQAPVLAVVQPAMPGRPMASVLPPAPGPRGASARRAALCVRQT